MQAADDFLALARDVVTASFAAKGRKVTVTEAFGGVLLTEEVAGARANEMFEPYPKDTETTYLTPRTWPANLVALFLVKYPTPTTKGRRRRSISSARSADCTYQVASRGRAQASPSSMMAPARA